MSNLWTSKVIVVIFCCCCCCVFCVSLCCVRVSVYLIYILKIMSHFIGVHMLWLKWFLSSTLAYACQSLLVLIFFSPLFTCSFISGIFEVHFIPCSFFILIIYALFLCDYDSHKRFSLSVSLRVVCMRNNCGLNDTDKVQ